jgi:hypothetical protein
VKRASMHRSRPKETRALAHAREARSRTRAPPRASRAHPVRGSDDQRSRRSTPSHSSGIDDSACDVVGSSLAERRSSSSRAQPHTMFGMAMRAPTMATARARFASRVDAWGSNAAARAAPARARARVTMVGAAHRTEKPRGCTACGCAAQRSHARRIRRARTACAPARAQGRKSSGPFVPATGSAPLVGDAVTKYVSRVAKV